MGNDIQRCRLSLGLLLADICLLVPVAIVAGLANSAFMGGTPNVSGFWTCMALAGGVLVVLNAAVELGLYWLRWLFGAVLAGRDEDECRSRNRTHVLYCPHAWEGGHGSCVVLRVVRVGAAARVGPSAARGGDGCLNRPRG